MKKIFILTLCAMLAFFATFGLMETSVADDNAANIPQTILSFINNSRWQGWQITGWVNPSGAHSSNACAFAVVKNGKENVLLAFGWKDNDWAYKWYNAAALPQVKDAILLSDDALVNDGFNAPRFSSYYLMNNETMEKRCFWVQQSNGSWRLVAMNCYDPLMFYDTSVDGALHLYNTGWVSSPVTDKWIYGSYQTNLRYFNLSEFPRTVKEAQTKLSNPPRIPNGSLQAREIKFVSGKKYPVYQGPGEEYGQAGKGKAVVSTNDWIQVFGKEGDWVLIQYDITSNHMRIGWIAADALPAKTSVSEFDFTPVIATTTQKVNMTDDPLYSQNAVMELTGSTQVYWLATMGEWAYVESVDAQPIRGFIPINAIASNK